MKWRILLEKGKPRIKRWVVRDGKGHTERYPTKKYEHFRDNPKEMAELVIRLNHPLVSKEAVELKHAFISPELLDKYRAYLFAQIPSKERAHAVYNWTYKYFLQFFIGRLNISNPLEWHLIHKTDWATYLVSKEVPAASTTKREIVAAANNFMVWLHEQRPSEVPPLVFKPITTAKYKKIEAERKLAGMTRKRINIKEEDWLLIKKNADPFLLPFMMLGYAFGLRRAEVLGVAQTDVRKKHLAVERQLVSIKPIYDVLKGRENRTVSYWYATPSETYQWIEHVQKNLMHPDTLTHMWNETVDNLKLEYDFHDLRHSFITNAIKVQHPRAVQLAAGHKNIETTMKYAHENYDPGDDVWDPNEAS